MFVHKDDVQFFQNRKYIQKLIKITLVALEASFDWNYYQLSLTCLLLLHMLFNIVLKHNVIRISSHLIFGTVWTYYLGVQSVSHLDICYMSYR